MTRRRSLTRARKRRICERNKWRTPQDDVVAIECGEFVTLKDGKPVQFDHNVALGMEGADDDGPNMQPMTPVAHADKTRRDIRAIAKVNRLLGKTKTKRRRPSLTHPTLMRKFDGTVVRREAR